MSSIGRLQRYLARFGALLSAPGPAIPRLIVLLFTATAVVQGMPMASAQDQELRYGLTPFYGTPMAPPLELADLEGQFHKLDDYRGKVVVVNFWATWCPPCIKEMPKLQKLWEQLGRDKFEVLAVNLGEEEQIVRRFVDTFKPRLEFPILLSQQETIVDPWRIRVLPMTYIVGGDGRWMYGEMGPRDFAHEHIVTRIQDLISAIH